ncbi:Heavy metal RND efflux outer membrane protein, CzcC family [Myxococcus hansupus]|uniref:Heavy metal RND efflux outer membrane protein, CzcC family n=1 Tax=Pseudomyxococcus hansupus TaxID=1297742 RepID=A0A0H4X9W8_9BACT|nr:TolC family protein [Myxococcus hansupus]AKQ70390.1 Heavy metal RND efflux outer membrane protein, CzcC family [Myxococcus hansupus]
MNALLLAALLSTSSVLLAQAGASSDAGTGQPASSAPALSPDTPEPPQFPVSDPLLEPIPPASLQVATWDEALRLLRQRSTTLYSALAQVEAAAGAQRVALATLLPTVTGTVSVQYNVLNPDATPLFGGGGGVGGGVGGGIGGGIGGDVGGGASPRLTRPPFLGLLNASMPLFNLSSIVALGTAREARRNATLTLAETRRQLTSALAQALVLVSAQERLAEVNRVNLRTALERLALTERRFELGAGTRLDVVRVQQDTETARNLVVLGDESLRKARETLGLVLGIPQSVGLARGARLEALLQNARRDCQPLESLERRADIEVARSRRTLAERRVSEVKASYAPTLALTSTTLALTVEEDFVTVPVWNIGASLVLPFWDGGAREGLLRQTRAGVELAKQGLLELERAATVEVVQARRAVDVADAAARIAGRGRTLAEENDRLTRRSFEVGTGTSLELIQTAADLRQAELVLVVREFELEQARVAAFLAEAACDW